MKGLLTAVVLVASLFSGCGRGSVPHGINAPAPDFTVKDEDHTVSLHDLKGKPVILNFWATFCLPCIEEMPSLVQLQKKLDSRVTILAVSIDTDDKAYHKFLKDHQVDLLTVRDPDQKVSTLYRTTMWPGTYLIDSKGIMRRKFIGAINWTSPEITEVLKNL